MSAIHTGAAEAATLLTAEQAEESHRNWENNSTQSPNKPWERPIRVAVANYHCIAAVMMIFSILVIWPPAVYSQTECNNWIRCMMWWGFLWDKHESDATSFPAEFAAAWTPELCFRTRHQDGWEAQVLVFNCKRHTAKNVLVRMMMLQSIQSVSTSTHSIFHMNAGGVK